MSTPADAVIRPRDLSFRCDAAGNRWWMGNDPVATAYYNTFSASFPQAERYFIECVRRWRVEAPPELQKHIAGFIAQESMHSLSTGVQPTRYVTAMTLRRSMRSSSDALTGREH
jgi:predicted metal-dependent hydrolase